MAVGRVRDVFAAAAHVEGRREPRHKRSGVDAGDAARGLARDVLEAHAEIGGPAAIDGPVILRI